ncbi:hypothetical protein [Leptospira stimsonii]|uniref:DNA primase/polymerase bifunctional N-terminal domain-containing protein n=1 Tax=Leptospira stimsonii TaxID=2202203 RepID=A0ABY2N3A8_9LEPT|nr:hypothetical protein [Leptospira stimsonii]TGK26076.1 hypothetical protein EHO98_00720 [Leptospira stimsonii]TGM14904.1 hypothetical protein EHQ90_10510 [Leptospira stimsonii]
MINTKHISNSEVILLPVKKDFEKGIFKQAVSYKNAIDLINNDNIKNTKIIKEILKKSYPYNSSSDFNYSFYLNPKYTNITVIDFDDYDTTLRKIKFLKKHNTTLNLYWGILEKEVFEKTFTVTTPSGGKHYYMRIPDNISKERIVGAIDPSEFLDEANLLEYFKTFDIDSIDKSKIKTLSKVKIDFIPNGVIQGPGF